MSSAPHFSSRLEVPARTGRDCLGRHWRQATGPPIAVRSPIDGSLLASFAGATAERRGRRGGRGRGGLSHVADGAGPAARRTGPPHRPAVPPAQGRPGRTAELGGRQDHARGAGRGPGDDRHLRLRRGPEPATLRPDDRQRAAAAPPGRAVASAGAGGRDHGLQLPRGRLGLERDARPGLRRSGGLEAVGEGAAVRPWPARRSWRRCWRKCPRRRRGVLGLVVGWGPTVGQALAASPGVPLVSATGSVRMGRAVAQTVAARLGRSLLELGGNNGMIVAPSADLELAVRSIVFAAVGTAGQRCTTLRRLIVHAEPRRSLLAAAAGRLRAAADRQSAARRACSSDR